jgi:hypothetical protein
MDWTGPVRSAVILTILAVTSDDALAEEVEDACREREYQFARIEEAVGLASTLAAVRPDVLLLDLRGRLEAALALARALTSRHPNLRIVVVGESPRADRHGFRIVDRWSAGPRILDQLELAYIGIPASVEEDFGLAAPWDEPA